MSGNTTNTPSTDTTQSSSTTPVLTPTPMRPARPTTPPINTTQSSSTAPVLTPTPTFTPSVKSRTARGPRPQVATQRSSPKPDPAKLAWKDQSFNRMGWKGAVEQQNEAHGEIIGAYVGIMKTAMQPLPAEEGRAMLKGAGEHFKTFQSLRTAYEDSTSRTPEGWRRSSGVPRRDISTTSTSTRGRNRRTRPTSPSGTGACRRWTT